MAYEKGNVIVLLGAGFHHIKDDAKDCASQPAENTYPTGNKAQCQP